MLQEIHGGGTDARATAEPNADLLPQNLAAQIGNAGAVAKGILLIVATLALLFGAKFGVTFWWDAYAANSMNRGMRAEPLQCDVTASGEWAGSSLER